MARQRQLALMLRVPRWRQVPWCTVRRAHQAGLDVICMARGLTKVRPEKGAASLVYLLVARRPDIAAFNDVWAAIVEIEAAVGTELR